MKINQIALSLVFVLGLACCYAAPIKVACVGDSITKGYPSQLGKILGDDFQVVKFAKSGAPLARYDKSKEYKGALAFTPDVVVIMLGTNDAHKKNWQSGEFFEKKLKSLVAEFRKANPKVKVYLCTPLPIFRSKWGHDGKLLAEKVVPTVKATATNEKCKIIDLYTLFLDKESIMKDGVHPKSAGYKVMAEKIAGALKSH